MKKGIITYPILAVGLILMTGILAMLLGILNLFPQETNQYITETISSYLGTAFFTCLLARIKTKQWEKAWEKQRYLHLSVMGLLFFLFRVANRFILGFFLRQEMPGAGYTISILTDLCLAVCLYLCLPKQGSKEDKSKEKDPATGTDTGILSGKPEHDTSIQTTAEEKK